VLHGSLQYLLPGHVLVHRLWDPHIGIKFCPWVEYITRKTYYHPVIIFLFRQLHCTPKVVILKKKSGWDLRNVDYTWHVMQVTAQALVTDVKSSHNSGQVIKANALIYNLLKSCSAVSTKSSLHNQLAPICSCSNMTFIQLHLRWFGQRSQTVGSDHWPRSVFTAFLPAGFCYFISKTLTS